MAADPLQDIDAPRDMLLRIVANHIQEQSCILFLGAGVHQPPAPSSSYKQIAAHPPIGSDLSRILAAECGVDRMPNEDPTNLRRVSQFYEMRLGRAALVQRLKKILGNCRPSLILKALAELDFPVIATTNYDTLIEDALRNAGKEPKRCVYHPNEYQHTPEMENGSPDAPALLKIHGDINTPESIVITDEDYIQFVMRMGDKEEFNPVPNTFRYALRTMPTLFIGYSLVDYNLRALFKTLRWKMDPARMPGSYAVDVKPDSLVVGVLGLPPRRFVQFIVDDMWRFVPELYRELKKKDLQQ
jgi:SIR2-like domain